MPNLVIVTGNIASGKTTILNMLNLEKYQGEVVIVPEPVDEWEQIRSADGSTFFERMYHNTHPQSAFHFQLVAITTRITLLRRAIGDNPQAKVFLCERSATEDCRVFAKMFQDSNRMSVDELTMIELLLKQWDMCVDDKAHYICLDIPATTCYERLSSRLVKGVRPSESQISLEYLQSLQTAYETFFASLDPASVHRGATLSTLERVLYDLVNTKH